MGCYRYGQLKFIRNVVRLVDRRELLQPAAVKKLAEMGSMLYDLITTEDIIALTTFEQFRAEA